MKNFLVWAWSSRKAWAGLLAFLVAAVLCALGKIPYTELVAVSTLLAGFLQASIAIEDHGAKSNPADVLPASAPKAPPTE